ncbi:flagellar hook assembly protein FlgD [Geothrix sp. 21YS21S-4]|uniref:flagellar hook assembly protein FlgD n=1 Tax=Geothrix sp. 21YS21S-4 TaxID=3068889 RepID=UPI0027BA98D4|nr:FlgD immunoglobulin-like domain containing protein [Geothrix sp. 21YS21S-4]
METGMISSTTASTSSTSTTSTAKNTLDKDGFLKLLVAQLQNQDPTGEGQDPNQMVQQLTSFSSLEQAQQTNTLLSGLQTQTSGLFQAQTASLVGKTVKVDGSGFNLKSGAASMNLELAKSASVTVTVKDAQGNTVATLPQGTLNSGTSTLTWDGRDSAGNQLADGAYSVSISATGTDGNAVSYKTSLQLKVDGVAFNSGGIYITSGTNTVSLDNVLEISA